MLFPTITQSVSHVGFIYTKNMTIKIYKYASNSYTLYTNPKTKIHQPKKLFFLGKKIRILLEPTFHK